MPEENTSPAAGATPNASTPATGNATGGATPPAATLTLEDAVKRIAELEHSYQNASQEVDRHRKKLTAYEKADKAAQEAALSDAEKTAKRLQEAEARAQLYQQQAVNSQVKMAAQAKGIIDPDVAALIVQKDLEMGDDGLPSNLENVLEKLVKNKPYLLGGKQEAPPPTPAHTLQAPAVPAMNPGRSTLASPVSTPRGKPPTLHDLQWKKN